MTPHQVFSIAGPRFLEAETAAITKNISDFWKDRSIETFDEQFVKETLLQGQLLPSVGSNYIGMKARFGSFKEFNMLSTKSEAPSLIHVSSLFVTPCSALFPCSFNDCCVVAE